jgi:hypothetical protein
MSHDLKYIGYVDLEIADILFLVHNGCSFSVSGGANNHNLPQSGRLLYRV